MQERLTRLIIRNTIIRTLLKRNGMNGIQKRREIRKISQEVMEMVQKNQNEL